MSARRAPRCGCGAPMRRDAEQCQVCENGAASDYPARQRWKRDLPVDAILETVTFGVPVDHAAEVARIAAAESVPQPVVWRAIVGWGIVHVRKAQADGAGKLIIDEAK